MLKTLLQTKKEYNTKTEDKLRQLRTRIGCTGMCYECTDFYVGAAGLGCRARSRYGELEDG